MMCEQFAGTLKIRNFLFRDQDFPGLPEKPKIDSPFPFQLIQIPKPTLRKHSIVITGEDKVAKIIKPFLSRTITPVAPVVPFAVKNGETKMKQKKKSAPKQKKQHHSKFPL